MKHLNVKLMLIIAGLLMTLNSYGGSNLTANQISQEYSLVQKRRASGYYGVMGGNFMAIHQLNIANHMSLVNQSKGCGDLYSLLPQMESGSYVFAPVHGQKPVNQFCLSLPEIVVLTTL